MDKKLVIDIMPLLKKERQNEIDQVIDNVYLTTGMSYPNDGLIAIVSKYGIDVLEWDFDDSDREIFGAIKYPEDGIKRPIILINKDKPDAKKTFTLAHEFGHYLLHEREGMKLWIDYDYTEDTEQMDMEREANYFAGALLMPKTRLGEVMAKTSNLNEVAKFFGVSRSALDVRLAWISKN